MSATGAALANDPTPRPLEAEYRPTRKVALLISNGNYPDGKGILPARKNLEDVSAALKALDFEVDANLDLNLEEMQTAIKSFSRRLQAQKIASASGDSMVVFYFCGHGLEIDGVNMLVPATVHPAGEDVLDNSVRLMEDIVNTLPTGYPGVVLAMIDACRVGYNTTEGKLSQVRPPDGSVLLFGARAGRPAVSPKSESQNTYFTKALVEQLREYNGATPIYDFCRLVEDRCLQNVTKLYEQENRKFAPQHPETSANIKGSFLLPAAKDLPPPAPSEIADARWNELQGLVNPRRLAIRCEAFLKDFPTSRFASAARVRLSGARGTLIAFSGRNGELLRLAFPKLSAAEVQRIENGEIKSPLRVGDLSLDALDDKAGDSGFREELSKALRGDKDAAQRIGEMYRDGRNGVRKSLDRYIAWLRLSTNLGSGISSLRLYELLNDSASPGDALTFLHLAVQQGYNAGNSKLIREYWKENK